MSEASDMWDEFRTHVIPATFEAMARGIREGLGLPDPDDEQKPETD